MKYSLLIIILFFPFLLTGQVITGLKSENGKATPKMIWSTQHLDKANKFAVYRSGMNPVKFEKINTILFSDTKNDSVFFVVIDTTLIKQGLYQYYLEVQINTDSVLNSDILFGHNMPGVPVPQLKTFNAESAKDKKAIQLTWKLNYNFTVKSLGLFRSRDYHTGYELVTHMPAEAEEYTDIVDISNEPYFYFIQINDFFGYQMPGIRIHGFCTYKEKPLPPQEFKVISLDGKPVLSWKNIGNNVIGNKIYRQTNESAEFNLFTEMVTPPENDYSFTDTLLSSVSASKIDYYVVSVSDGFLESNPTDTLSFHQEKKNELAPPWEISYRLDSAGNMMLIWDRQDMEPNLAGYNIYKIIADKPIQKLNTKLIPYIQNFFTDVNYIGFDEIIYEIETVSTNGTTGELRSTIKISENLTVPELILSLQKIKNTVKIDWEYPDWKGINKIELYQQKNDEEPVFIKQLAKEQTSFTNTISGSGNLYTYFVIATLTNNKRIYVNNGVSIRF